MNKRRQSSDSAAMSDVRSSGESIGAKSSSTANRAEGEADDKELEYSRSLAKSRHHSPYCETVHEHLGTLKSHRESGQYESSESAKHRASSSYHSSDENPEEENLSLSRMEGDYKKHIDHHTVFTLDPIIMDLLAYPKCHHA